MNRIDISKWWKFKLEDLFDITSSSWLNLWKLEISKIKWENCYEFIWRTKVNYWVQGYLQKQDNCELNEENVISVSQIGSVHAQIRYNKWYSSQNIFILHQKEEFGLSLLNHFLITVINKILQKYDSAYTSYPTLKSLKEETIYLPVNNDNQINFDYIENYIKTFELRESIHIISNSLNKLSNNWIDIRKWKEFKISDLFDIRSSRKIFHWVNIIITNEKTENSYPYVVRSSMNNWIKWYISKDKEFLNQWNSITFAQDTFIAFYQKESFFTGNKIKVFYLKWYDLNEKLGKYLTTIINSRIQYFYWWIGSNIESISNLDIYLPVTSSWEPDWKYMENYIKKLETIERKIIDYFK